MARPSRLHAKSSFVLFPIAVLLAGFVFVMSCSDSSTTAPKNGGNGEEPSYCEMQPLSAPTNTVINVTTSLELMDAFTAANDGGNVTIMLADGVYPLTQQLFLHADDVTIRSASGNRDNVIIGGGGMEGTVPYCISIEGKNFTLADLTIGDVRDYVLLILHDSDDCLVHNVRFFDSGGFLLKVASDDGAASRTERGVVEWCLFEYTAGQVPSTYTGGINALQAVDWVVHHNIFRYIDFPGSEIAGPAIMFWVECSNTIVEHNTIYGCDRGIAYGWGSEGGSHVGGIIRNNMIHITNGVGISLESTTHTKVYNNSIWLNDDNASILPRYSTTQYVSIINNLSNAAMWFSEGATGVMETNFTNAQASWFVDPLNGNLSLADTNTTVCEQGQSLTDVAMDFECEARPKGDFYDLGADEY